MTFSLRTRTLPALSTLTLAMLQSWAVYAQTAPNAGQVSREAQQQPAQALPQAAPTLRVEGVPASSASSNDVRFVVKSFQISGNTAIPTPELQALLSDLVGNQQSLLTLNGAAERITTYYRSHGYAVARAYLPAQDIKDGAVAIAILEGRIDKHLLKNGSRLSDQRANGYIEQTETGTAIRSAQVDRSLLLLNDTPGVGSARATLQPGASVGTSDLVVELDPAAPYAGSVSFDNYGNRYTGQYRLGAALFINSPLHIGDQLSFSGLTSDQSMTYARLAYQLPVGIDGLRLGAAYFDTRYRLGKEFASLNAHGKANSASVFATYPFIRSQQSNLSGSANLEQKNFTDVVDRTATTNDKQARLLNLGLTGNRQDGLGGGGFNSLDLSLVFGRLNIKSPGALAIDAASAQSNGSYTRLSYAISRLQRLNESNQLSVSLSGQQASKNLDSSEKFALGGANGVRAYPQGEGIGDQGYLATLELRHEFSNVLQGTLFYDTGSVTINHNQYGTPAANSRTLGGVGVGVNAALKGIQVKASLAWRTQGGDPTSVPASAAKTPTLLLQASGAF